MALAVQPVTSSSSSLSSVVSSVSTRSSPSTIRPMINNSNRSVNTKFIVDWNSPSKTTALSNKTKTTDDNLQDAFRRFREQRMEEMRIQQRIESRKKKKIRRSNPQRMRRLRLKFVEQAKRYLGIPYAKKYFEPGTSEYESKLFLDCCGLVRRVMYDLAKDFGFTIGPWNQSYMYDTLPKTITSLTDVKPGDLVFISATYYNPKMKKQRHDLTHVEIMLGEGEKTIGARWNNGKVQFFDSYKFVSKSYHSQVYTIKSLDPWLKGICKSCCTEHPWRRRRYKKVNKNSIFFSRDQSNRGHHHRSHSSKRTSSRSKSQKNTNLTISSTEQITTNLNNEQLPVSSTIDIESISEDDDDDEDDSIDILGNQLTKLNCQGEEEEECDDSDSMDDALNAEQFDDDIESSIVTTTTTTVQS
ncbi:unnamed protein product [Adineta steineri]|uniref:NlpC/P60 domain-containing protein n=1 Tax=Adineta steineri TaxID=433720 RepID=A0A815CWQ3_9BILA|nr:unnamed protein product [Adineta steineri]CAF1566602.1 unnamed protein product [Adineta steineri]